MNVIAYGLAPLDNLHAILDGSRRDTYEQVVRAWQDLGEDDNLYAVAVIDRGDSVDIVDASELDLD